METDILILIGALAVVVLGSLPGCTFFEGREGNTPNSRDLDRSLVDPDERIDEMRNAR